MRLDGVWASGGVRFAFLEFIAGGEVVSAPGLLGNVSLMLYRICLSAQGRSVGVALAGCVILRLVLCGQRDFLVRYVPVICVQQL